MNKWTRCEPRTGSVPPGWLSMHHWYIVLPHRRCRRLQGVVWSVSAESNERMRTSDGEWKRGLTLLILNASPRCWASSSPIRMNVIESVVSVFREWLWSSDCIDERSSCLTRLTFNPSARWLIPLAQVKTDFRYNPSSFNVCEEEGRQFNRSSKETFSHMITLQSIAKVMNHLTIQLHQVNIEACECLSREIRTMRWKKPRSSFSTHFTWLIFNASARWWTPLLSISSSCKWSVVSVYRVSVYWLNSLIPSKPILHDWSSLRQQETGRLFRRCCSRRDPMFRVTVKYR